MGKRSLTPTPGAAAAARRPYGRLRKLRLGERIRTPRLWTFEQRPEEARQAGADPADAIKPPHAETRKGTASQRRPWEVKEDTTSAGGLYP